MTAGDEPVDVRLVPAALAVWGAAAVVLPWSAGVLLACGLVLGTAASAVAVARCRHATRHGGPVPDRETGPDREPGRDRTSGRDRVSVPPRVRVHAVRGASWGQVTLVLGAVVVLLLTTSAQARVREAGDLRALAADGARVRLVGVVRSTPQPLTGGGSEPTVRFLLAARSVGVGDERPASTGAAVEVVAPAAAGDLAYGTTVEVESRLGAVPDRARRSVARARTTQVPRVQAPPPIPLRAADGLRAGLVGTSAAVPGDAGRLLPAVAVGDTRGVGDLDEAMRVSGLAHLTAVSGAHFSLLGAVVLAGAARCRVPRRWRWLPVSAVTAAFVAVVQPGSSVVRAAVMGAVGVLGIVAGRPARSVPALASAVLVLLLVDPWLARDIGFVLSVVATAGIALLAAPLARRWSSVAGVATGPGAAAREPGPAAGPVATALAVPVAAQLVCAPVVLVLSPAVPTYAVLANVVVAPAVGPATIGGLLAALLAPAWPAGAEWCAQLAGAGCWWIAAVARTAAGLPGAQVAWAGGVPGQVLLACAGAATLVLVLRCRRGMAP